LFVLAASLLIVRASDEDASTAVLGTHLLRPTTTESAASPTAPPTLADLTTIAGPALSPSTTTAPAPASTSTTANPATTTTTTAAVPSGRVVERADVTSVFDYRPDGTGGAMSTVDNRRPRDPFVLQALGSDADHDGVAELKAEMANQTNRDITFPGGLVLRFFLQRDGQRFRTVELRFPDTQTLAPGASLEVESATPLDKQYGRYQVDGEVPVRYS
jgi:hypothetical protein